MINLTALPLISAALCAVIAAVMLQRVFPIDTASGRDARVTQTMLQPDPATQRQALPFWRAHPGAALSFGEAPARRECGGDRAPVVVGPIEWRVARLDR